MNNFTNKFRAGQLALTATLTIASGVPVESAQPANNPTLETRLQSVSLFKNGLGYMRRETQLPRGNATIVIEDLPAPAHGTFWVSSPDNAAVLTDVIAYEKDSVRTQETVTVAELLEANVDATVELRINDKETIRGKLVAVPPNRPTEQPAGVPLRSLYLNNPPAETASLVLLQSTNGMVALDKNTIRQVTAVDAQFKTTIERKKRVAALQLRSANPAGKGRLIIQYLAKGITWAPSCVLDISDPQTARLTTKAQIINEIEDLDGVAVDFVAGFPNLQFADVNDPVGLRGDLAAFLTSLLNPAQPGGRGRRGAVMQQAVLANVAYIQEDILPVFPTTPPEGQTREELFFYEQKSVTLKKGERGYYPLFTVETPYEHVYEWKIPDALGRDERYRSSETRETESPEEVWHSVRLTNTGNIPWTTSPAMTMQDGQLLGQDLLYYTSPGSKTTVKITQAVDIKAEQAEYEVERKRNAARFYDSNYDLVTVRGQLKVANFKNKEVKLTITKDLSGEVLKTAPEAKVDQVAKGLKKVNPHSQLCWELPIKSRDKIEIEYRYNVYVRE